MAKPVILVVDDEKEARTTILKFLTMRYDCDFNEAKDGDEAIAFIKTNTCDVMLLDIKMPKRSGLSIIKETKTINPHMDILIVSAYVSGDVVDQTLRLGATDYILKPINLEALSLKFAALLEKRGQRINKT